MNSFRMLLILLTVTNCCTFINAYSSKSESSQLLRKDSNNDWSEQEEYLLLELLRGNYAELIDSFYKDLDLYHEFRSKVDLLYVVLSMKKDGYEALVFFLFSHGIYVSVETICWVLEYSTLDLIKLLRFGLSPDFKLKNGDMLLHHLIKNKNMHGVKNWSNVFILLRSGADVLLLDPAGHSPFWYVTVDDMKSIEFKNYKDEFWPYLSLWQRAQYNQLHDDQSIYPFLILSGLVLSCGTWIYSAHTIRDAVEKLCTVINRE